MLKFPLSFEVESNTPKGMNTTWESKSGSLPPISCAIPPEFSGPGGGYSPEDFFAMAALNCIIATFKVYAEKSNQEFENLSGKVKAIMNKDPKEGCLAITDLEIEIHIKGAKDPEKIKKTVEQAIKECAVCNSIKCGKTFNLTVE
jgi:uncharacterized OsmC-like protein